VLSMRKNVRIMHNYIKRAVASIEHQTVTKCRGSSVEQLHLPAPQVEILPGVRWGRFEEFFTPAFWISREWIDGGRSALANYAIGGSLREEVAACLLGGHGMPAEVGLAAFRRLRERGLLDGRCAQGVIESALAEPLAVSERRVKYRFPRTKARFVSLAMQRLNVEAAPTKSGRGLRDWLLTFYGIGPKTASWIARNAVHSDEVAILDIHLIRAGVLMGLFSPRQSVQRDYFRMEERLVSFARIVGMRLSRFDNMVWCYMRQLNRLALDAVAGMELDENIG
jgi:N-glycosylase/DNA lyase